LRTICCGRKSARNSSIPAENQQEKRTPLSDSESEKASPFSYSEIEKAQRKIGMIPKKTLQKRASYSHFLEFFSKKQVALPDQRKRKEPKEKESHPLINVGVIIIILFSFFA